MAVEIPPDQQQPSGSAAELSAMDNLAELTALVHLLKEQYQQQVIATKQMAKAEWQLSTRSFAVSLTLFGAMIVIGMVLWASIMLAAGYALLLATTSVAVSATLLILLQVILLIWCAKSAKYLLKQIGFSHTKQQIREFFHTTPQPGDSNANRAAD